VKLVNVRVSLNFKVGENECSDNMYSFGRRVLLTRSFLYFAFAFIFYL